MTGLSSLTHERPADFSFVKPCHFLPWQFSGHESLLPFVFVCVLTQQISQIAFAVDNSVAETKENQPLKTFETFLSVENSENCRGFHFRNHEFLFTNISRSLGLTTNLPTHQPWTTLPGPSSFLRDVFSPSPTALNRSLKPPSYQSDPGLLFEKRYGPDQGEDRKNHQIHLETPISTLTRSPFKAFEKQ